MAVVGTAYVRVKLISDRMAADLNKAIDGAFNKAKLDKVGTDAGKRIGKKVAESLGDQNVTVNAQADTTKAKEALDEAARPRTATIEGDADTGKANEDLDHLAKKRQAKVEAKAAKEAARKAAVALAWLARTRRAVVRPVLDNPAYAKVEAALMRLSGGRVLKEVGEKLLNIGKNMDVIAPIVGSIVTGLYALTGAAGAAIGNISGLVYSLGALGPAALVLPGLFAGMATTMLVLSTIMKSASKKGDFAAVGKQFSALRTSLGDSFWNVAIDPFKRMTYVVFPMLRYELGAVFKAFGHLATGIFDTLRSFPGMQTLVRIIRDIRRGVDTAAKGSGAWTMAILKLVSIGTAYLPRLFEWSNKIGKSFDAWLSGGIKDKTIFQAVNGAIIAFKNLWTILEQTGGILEAIGRAAAKAGSSGLGTFAESLRGVNRALSDTKGQNALVGFFKASHDAMAAMGPGLKAFGDAIVNSVIPSLGTLLPIAGKALGTVFQILASILSNPAFTAGMVTLVSGVAAAFLRLQEAAPQLGTFLGAVATAFGMMTDAVGAVLSNGLKLLGPILTQIATALGNITDPLSSTLIDAMYKLAPLISAVVTPLANFVSNNPDQAAHILLLAGAFGFMATKLKGIMDVGGKVVGFFKGFAEKVVPALGETTGLTSKLSALWDVFGKAFIITTVITSLIGMWTQSEKFRQSVTELGKVLWNLIKGVFSALKPTFSQLSPVLGQAYKDMGDIAAIVINTLLPALKFLTPIIVWLAKLFGGVLASSLNVLSGLLHAFVQLLTGDFSGAWGTLKTTFETGAQPLADVLQKPLQIAARAVGDWFKGIGHDFAQGWRDIVSGVGGWLSGIGQSITSGLSTAQSAVTGWFTDVGTWFSDGWKSIVDGVTGFFSDLGGQITSSASSVGDWFTPITDFASGFWGGVETVFEAGFTAAWESLKAVVAAGILTITALFEGDNQLLSDTWNGFLNTMSGIWTTFLTTLQGVWNQAWGFITGAISSAWGAITGFASQLWTVLGQVTTYMVNLPGQLWGVISRWGVQMIGWAIGLWAQVTDAFSRGVSAAGSWVANLPSMVWGYIGSFATQFIAWALRTWASVTMAFSNGVNTAANFIANLPQRIWGYLGDLKNLAGRLYDYGVNMVMGFIHGIEDKIRDVANAASNMASTAISWAKRTLGINSPSRVFRAFGRGTGEGFIKGMRDMLGSVGRAGANLVKAAIPTDGINIPLSLSPLTAPALAGVPQLATGGTVQPQPGGTLALLAENRQPERVEPLDANGMSKRDYAMLDAIKALIGAGGSISIGNLLIPLEDLAQLKTLEDFINMLRVRARKAG